MTSKGLMRYLTVAIFVTFVVFFAVGMAHADGVLPAHQASITDVAPCTSGSHWVLTGADGVTSATLTVDGVDYAMSPNGAGHEWDADAAAVTDESVAFVTFTGELTENALLNLSHCLEGSPSPTPPPTSPPTPTPTPTDTPSPSTSSTPPPTTTSSPPPSSSTSTHTPPPSSTSTSSATSPGTSEQPPVHTTASTGLTTAGKAAAVVGVCLLVIGSLAIRLASRKS